jgi:very-short-patch-repair endonuclease
VETASLEFSTTGSHRSSWRDTVVHHVRSLGPLITVERIPVTSVARTLVDLARSAGPLTLQLALESALRRDRVTVDQVRAELELTGPTTRGRATLRAVLERYPLRKSDSALEVIVERLLVDGGLPRPIRQFEVWEQERYIARIDLAYPEELIAIETDGFDSHASVLEFRRDRRRQNVLVTRGWTIYRPTWLDATRNQDRIVSDVATLLARASSVPIIGST